MKTTFSGAFFMHRNEFDIEIRVGAGAYVCGEGNQPSELAGGQARAWCAPSRRCPRSRGSWGRPTVVNNVISLATVPVIFEKGARALTRVSGLAGPRARCRCRSRATSSTAASSRRPSACPWASWSTTSRAARPAGRPVKAVQVGGPLGAYFAPAKFDTPFAYEEFDGQGGLIGHAGVVVFDDTADMLGMARFRHGILRGGILRQMHALPHRRGEGRRDHRPHRAGRRGRHPAAWSILCETMKDGSLCALGGFTPYPPL